MKSKHLILNAILLTVLLFGQVQELASQTSNNFLQFAEGAGELLVNEATPVGNGYKWADSTGTTNYYTELYDGSPGIATLFSELYEATGNVQYSQFAEGGAQWLMEQAIPDSIGYKWPMMEGSSIFSAGLYTGVAGTGDAFLKLYEAFGDTLYLYYAKGAADWILSVAVFESPFQCKWAHRQGYTDYSKDIISGSAGIGLFLLKIYEITSNPAYLTYARFAGNYLVNQAIPVGSGYKWEISNNNPAIYTGFSHGTAGIAYFLADLFEHANDNVYLDFAEGAAQWLIDIAEPESGGCKWWLLEGIAPTYATGWCHGPAGTCLPFMKLYQITSDPVYLDYAKLGAAWLINTGGYKYDITVCHGAAGVGDFFLELFNLMDDSLYYENAVDAALWLESKADSSGVGYRWATFGGFYTGFSVGTAGVGHFFLKLNNQNLSPYRIESNIENPSVHLQNFPNPFTQSTVIRIQGLEGSEKAGIEIHTIDGRLIRSIPISNSKIPIKEVEWDGKNELGENVSSGIYFARLKVDGKYFNSTKILCLKSP
ncbi:MAG: T9SS type A sorting domain-containing protein [Bacteroidales bacterium]|nr:T9SS type A sorting domain-containing protein [Bacteroidales bacterium]MCF8456191.1 T9SS type A sorting domain-containing protein [Bacteroidales bacterium]